MKIISVQFKTPILIGRNSIPETTLDPSKHYDQKPIKVSFTHDKGLRIEFVGTEFSQHIPVHNVCRVLVANEKVEQSNKGGAAGRTSEA